MDEQQTKGGAYESDPAARFDASEERWSPMRWTGGLGQLLVDAIDRSLLSRRAVGARPAHTHGFVVKALFEPTDRSVALDRLKELTDFAPLFGGPTDVLVRFSNLACELDEPDVMGMATKFMPADDELTDLVAMSAEVFPVTESRDFADFLDAQRNVLLMPWRIASMILTRRASARAVWHLFNAKRVNHGNGMATVYHGVQTFRLVHRVRDAPSVFTPMRYQWVPDTANPGGTYQDLRRLLDGNEEIKATFHLDLAIRPLGSRMTPRERERLDDPRYSWANDVEIIRAGKLSLTARYEEQPGKLAFNPSVLAPGISLGDDDIFNGRKTSYAVSASRRVEESKRMQESVRKSL